MSQLFRSIIMGAPASGKGTISSRIAKCFDIKHVSSGDLLRLHIMHNTELGAKAKLHVNEGDLVPDNIMCELITHELRQLSHSNWLLDGFPRTVEQAKLLCSGEHVDVVLSLVVPCEVIIERVRGRWIHLPSGRVYNTNFNSPRVMGKDDITGEELVQRADDHPDAVRKRLEIYSETAEPLLNFYQKAGILKQFCGNASNEIWPHVYDCLKLYMEPKSSVHVYSESRLN